MTAKTVGIIGGMGPDATIELMRRIIDATPATDDEDHIHMLVDNNPKIPSRIKALLEGNGEDPTPVLVEMAVRLQNAGADFLVIPCNTAHHYYQDIQDSVSIPLWHIINLSLAHIKQQHPEAETIGLLASSAVQRINLFEPCFEKQHLNLYYPPEDKQKTIMSVIRSVKAGTVDSGLLDSYISTLAAISGSGKCDAFLLGCSELSTLRDEHNMDIPVIDALQVMAESVVQFCLK